MAVLKETHQICSLVKHPNSHLNFENHKRSLMEHFSITSGADPEDPGSVWLPPAGLYQSQGAGERAANASDRKVEQ